MKKLFVLALAGIMILSMAAVSMAAVTTGGEVNFGFNLNDLNKDFGDAKVTFTAPLNDEVTAFMALKGSTDPLSGAKVGVDETWVSFKEGFGTIKVGYYGWNIKDNVDIIDNLVGYEIKNNANISADFAVAEGMTLSALVARPTDNMDMGAKLTYKTDAFGASVGYDKKDGDTDSHIDLNGWYNLKPAVIYMTYMMNGDNKDAVLGASYDTDSIYARAEFEVVKPDNQDNSGSGIRVGYKLGNGAKVEYQTKTTYASNIETKDSQIKLNVAF